MQRAAGSTTRRAAVLAALPYASASRASTRQAARRFPRVVARAEGEDDEGSSSPMADIGLGDLEDVMEKAGGGSTATPDWVPDILGSTDMDLAQKLLREKYGETLYRELGFSKFAETINGRLAMIGVVAGIGALFRGDVLTQFAIAPLPAVVVSVAVIVASLVPTVRPEGYVPDSVKDGLAQVVKDAELDDIFTEGAELVNGRAAMIGFLALTLLGIVF